MKNVEQGNTNINRKYSIELRKQNIIQFLLENLNQDGIDLDNLYVGRLTYIEDGFDNDNKIFNNKLAIVYFVDNLEKDILYMDLFKEILYEKTTYVIPGVLSFAPFTRKGLTISEIFKLSNLLNLKRMQIEEIKEFFSKIEDINYYDFLSIPLEKMNFLLEDKLKR